MPTFEDATRKLYERKLALKEGGDQPVVGALSDIDWEDFTEIDYQETIELNTLATMIILSIIYIPVGFIVASLYPIYIILMLTQGGDAATLWSDYWALLGTIVETILTTPIEIARLTFAVSWNLFFFFYNSYINLLQWAWLWFEQYFSWIADIIGVTTELLWLTLRLFANFTWHLSRWSIKISIVFVQWFIETFYDSFEWLWDAFIATLEWLYRTFEGLFKVSIIIPAWGIAKLIVIFDWATYFAWRYDEFLASDFYINTVYDQYISMYWGLFWFGVYLALWPITFPITILVFLWVLFFAWW